MRDTIETVRGHLADGSPRSLTYAALECRLALERVCYDRLARAHDYLSHDEVRRWQPHHVIGLIADDVDPHVTSTYTIAISRNPTGPGDDLTKLEYVDLGTQQGFDGPTLAKLWNSLSGMALHVRLPTSSGEAVGQYGDPGPIRSKVERCLAEMERIALGTLTSTGFGEEVSFRCVCLTNIRRRAGPLKDGKVIHCNNPQCLETWEACHEDGEINFIRRSVEVECSCGLLNSVPMKMLDRMRPSEALTATCACGLDTEFEWRLVHGQPPAVGGAG